MILAFIFLMPTLPHLVYGMAWQYNADIRRQVGQMWLLHFIAVCSKSSTLTSLNLLFSSRADESINGNSYDTYLTGL